MCVCVESLRVSGRRLEGDVLVCMEEGMGGVKYEKRSSGTRLFSSDISRMEFR